jgi:hypothetical protein
MHGAEAGTGTPGDHGSDHGADGSYEWAWVELNYRPHAYQTAPVCWLAMTSVDFTGFRSISC